MRYDAYDDDDDDGEALVHCVMTAHILLFQLQDGFFDWISRTPPKFHWVRFSWNALYCLGL